VDSVSLPVYTRIDVKRSYLDKNTFIEYWEKTRYFDPDTVKSIDTFFVKGAKWRYKRNNQYYLYFSKKSFIKNEPIKFYSYNLTDEDSGKYEYYFEYRPLKIIEANNRKIYVFDWFMIQSKSFDKLGEIYFDPKIGSIRINGWPDMDLYMINYKEINCK
jgi:hypothetical protein